jgi:uncharacterized protein with HEPN domain
MEPRDREALGDISIAIRRVQGFPITDREAFLASDVLQGAVVRNLELLVIRANAVGRASLPAPNG